MKISKLILLGMVCLISLNVMSQSYGLKAGVNLSKLNLKDDDGTYNDDMKYNPGFCVGLILNYEVASIISIETGLDVTTKGLMYKQDINGTTFTEKLRLIYADIPIALKVRAELGGDNAFYIKGGPYVGVGITGKDAISGGGDSDSSDIEWGSDEDEADFRRLDYGAVFGAGLELGIIQIGVAYNFGLANMVPYSDNGAKVSNRTIQFSLGVLF